MNSKSSCYCANYSEMNKTLIIKIEGSKELRDRVLNLMFLMDRNLKDFYPSRLG